jgi:hypothetical protein
VTEKKIAYCDGCGEWLNMETGFSIYETGAYSGIPENFYFYSYKSDKRIPSNRLDFCNIDCFRKFLDSVEAS